MLRKRVDASRGADEGDEVGGEDRGAVREEVGRARQTAGLDPAGEPLLLQLLAPRDLLERQKGRQDVAEIRLLERRMWPVRDESGHASNSEPATPAMLRISPKSRIPSIRPTLEGDRNPA